MVITTKGTVPNSTPLRNPLWTPLPHPNIQLFSRKKNRAPVHRWKGRVVHRELVLKGAKENSWFSTDSVQHKNATLKLSINARVNKRPQTPLAVLLRPSRQQETGHSSSVTKKVPTHYTGRDGTGSEPLSRRKHSTSLFTLKAVLAGTIQHRKRTIPYISTIIQTPISPPVHPPQLKSPESRTRVLDITKKSGMLVSVKVTTIPLTKDLPGTSIQRMQIIKKTVKVPTALKVAPCPVTAPSSRVTTNVILVGERAFLRRWASFRGRSGSFSCRRLYSSVYLGQLGSRCGVSFRGRSGGHYPLTGSQRGSRTERPVFKIYWNKTWP